MRISDWSSDVCSSDLCPALFALDPDFLVPAHTDQLGQAPRVVFIALVYPRRKHRMSMARLDTYHWKADPMEFVPKPARHHAAFETNAFCLGRVFCDEIGRASCRERVCQ